MASGSGHGLTFLNFATYIYICVGVVLVHESECDMEKLFTSRLIYFNEPEASENNK